MLVLDRQITDQDLWIEIRQRLQPLSAAASDLLAHGIDLTRQSRIMRLESPGLQLSSEHLLALADPLNETVTINGGDGNPGAAVDVFCRSGVTDAEGEMASLALQIAGTPGIRCHAGLRYRFAQPVMEVEREAVESLLGNSLIQQFLWHGERDRDHPVDACRSTVSPSPAAQAIELRHAGDNELLSISRRFNLALDLDEMRAVSQHYQNRGRPPTDVELQSIALTWSEHCSHKTFKSPILFDHDGSVVHIPGLLAACIASPTRRLNRHWVRSAFDDNAGVIAFDGKHDLAFKVETHNHPSALEPYGGAHTGLGGVIRDILAVSAEPIANTDVLCFGPLDLPASSVPRGSFHPQRTYREVVRGIAGYGNNMGIPTIGGAVLFHPGYTANPLVYCGTLGIAPRGSHPRDPRPGDRIVVLGGRTGRDGLHGATMSSEALDRATVETSTVQIGAPITEKAIRDVLPLLRDEHLYHAITDCGAGGLCSAVGEMGERLGADLDLALVPLKYPGLAPWEIWLSEAQERMVLAVPEASISRLRQLCGKHDVEATLIGTFRDDGLLLLRYGEDVVADIDLSFLHGGRPVRTLRARYVEHSSPAYSSGDIPDAAGWLLRLLAHPNIASKEDVIRVYDFEVGANTVIKPLTANAGPSDAAVLRPLASSWRGAVVSHGINPLYGALDPHAMAMLVVDEALRNLVAVGGSIDKTVLLDNFCWGNVDDPQELGALVRAAQGCHDAALAYGTPFISGKDSLRNTSAGGAESHSIPGTLLISALGVVPDVRQSVTMELKQPGNRLYLVGQTADELGGSHYQLIRQAAGGQVPRVRPVESVRVMRAVTCAIRGGLVAACHDLSEGGLAVAAAEMSLAGRLGLVIDLERVPARTDALEALLFAESSGRFLVEVAPEHAAAWEKLLAGLPHAYIGDVSDTPQFVIRHRGKNVIDLTVSEVERAWKGVVSLDQPFVAGHASSNIAAALAEIGHDDGRDLEREGSGCTSEHVGVSDAHFRRVIARPRVLVLGAAGVNCDRETVEACRLAGAEPTLIHLNQFLAGEASILDFSMLILPGGFSYGDHLGAGAMLATVLRHRLSDDLHHFATDGRPILGICNGFQILARLGLLGDISLVGNSTGRFECRWVSLRIAPSPCLFLRDIETCELPIAHGEGRVVIPEHALPDVLRRAPLRYEENPNGSFAGIAGITNENGNVFGLMPHPERYVTRYQHPAWRPEEPAGLAIFRNAIRYAREEL